MRSLQIAFLLCSFLLCASEEDRLTPMSIEEKLSMVGANPPQNSPSEDQVGSSSQILQRLSQVRHDLREKYIRSQQLIEKSASEDQSLELLDEINELRSELIELEQMWRSLQSQEIQKDSEASGIWQNEETSISELVMEYGSSDYLYVIPPEVAVLKLNLHSALLIPRDSWSSLIEAIFKHNGIGVKEINPYVKQLYLLKQDFITFSSIIVEKEQLAFFEKRERIAFVYSPPIAQLKQAFYFIERFRDPKTTFVYQAGAKIAIVGFQEEVKRLVNLCDNVWENGGDKVVRVVTSSKLQSEEMIKVLKSYFGGLSDPSRSIITMKGGHDLTATPLASESGIILIGEKALVEKAEAVVRETECQVSDPSELTVFWHTCSHSNPTDLADVLDRVYTSLIHTAMEIPSEEGMVTKDPHFGEGVTDSGDDDIEQGLYNPPLERVKPWSTRLGRSKEKKNDTDELKIKSGNFIPYPSTGSILMVIRKDMVGKIKEVIRRLDIPKRMVEIEVLMVERRLKNTARSGINILKLGSAADNINQLGAEFYGDGTKAMKGLFEFIYSGTKNVHFPAIDLSYNFLLSQEDIRVTAAPSVITINQSPAIISITDQISINNGASPVQTNNGFVFKDSYERADFGITIKLTPTVHEPEIGDADGQIYVTLENDISFETIKRLDGGENHKPDVHKRQVKNQVRIPDGQTVILGGLKSKNQEDKTDKIPFLGEIPGFGKLFGTNLLTDTSGEMFIFIKPRVVHDPKTDLIQLREEKLRARPGDIQGYLDRIAESRKKSSERTFKRSWNMFFGMREDGTVKL